MELTIRRLTGARDAARAAAGILRLQLLECNDAAGGFIDDVCQECGDEVGPIKDADGHSEGCQIAANCPALARAEAGSPGLVTDAAVLLAAEEWDVAQLACDQVLPSEITDAMLARVATARSALVDAIHARARSAR